MPRMGTFPGGLSLEDQTEQTNKQRKVSIAEDRMFPGGLSTKPPSTEISTTEHRDGPILGQKLNDILWADRLFLSTHSSRYFNFLYVSTFLIELFFVERSDCKFSSKSIYSMNTGPLSIYKFYPGIVKTMIYAWIKFINL